MGSYILNRSNSSPLIAWSSHSPLSRTYFLSDISTYASAPDYFKERWSTNYNPYHFSRRPYYWPHYRNSALYPLYSVHDDTRYRYESPYHGTVPSTYPSCDYASDANYYAYVLDSYRAAWRGWPYGRETTTYAYRTYWPWRGSIRNHYWYS